MTASVGLQRRVQAIARGTQIESRASVISAAQVAALGSIAERNAIYEAEAPKLAQAAAAALQGSFDDVSYLVTTSCTGYMVPGLDVELAKRLGLDPRVARLPITEAGCAGGVVALARAADHLRLRSSSALVVATELCSLAFHADAEDGNLTSALLFGDGAGAVLLQNGEPDNGSLEIVDSCSYLIPCSEEVLGFRLTDSGFFPLLSRSLVERLPGPTLEALSSLLTANGLQRDEIGFWLIHPGGPRVLTALQSELAIEPEVTRWSWQTLHQSGNTSSAAIIEVLSHYLADPDAPKGWGVAIAFGPGVSIEMLLLRAC
ncbi:MAG TPA: 3-oxoacyl-[acyl-carrier-protein] synthase III C-terminal domain-containing protein [Dehalococcoidia bacterium]|nr:3-oxoacyl-[acyl-carrier-protein] synthase III C-terminal domain-containing protein [Dehalococcoidia bacterium]